MCLGWAGRPHPRTEEEGEETSWGQSSLNQLPTSSSSSVHTARLTAEDSDLEQAAVSHNPCLFPGQNQRLSELEDLPSGATHWLKL